MFLILAANFDIDASRSGLLAIISLNWLSFILNKSFSDDIWLFNVLIWDCNDFSLKLATCGTFLK